MAPKFGTSGLRGLVTELTDDLVTRYVQAFLVACPTNGTVHIGEDLRPSSASIARVVADAVVAAGQTAVMHGVVPTPALALASLSSQNAAIMVTGSHIPADRNGLKFYVPSGEIGKEDEAKIERCLGQIAQYSGTGPAIESDRTIDHFVQRYLHAFARDALSGMRIGVYQHSSVARDMMGTLLEGLGATIVPLARSETFVPVDTEAVDPETQVMLAGWARDHDLDAVVSTDGDADRPMVAGQTGAIVPGDILGPLTALFLGAETIVAPVSSNTLIDEMADFTACHRTRIGSPYVIEKMEDLRRADPASHVIGYEANGGLLLGFTAQGPEGPIVPLMTRDSILPMIAPLVMARAQGLSIDALAATLPPRVTATGRVQNIPTDQSAQFIETLRTDPSARRAFFKVEGRETGVDTTDGLRVTFDPHVILHIRPSGNAPECRFYVESTDRAHAEEMLRTHLAKLSAQFG